MSPLCLWGDPPLPHPSPPIPVNPHAEIEETWLEVTITGSWHAIKRKAPCQWKQDLREEELLLLLFSIFCKKTEKLKVFYIIDMQNQEFSPALQPHVSCLLMAFCLDFKVELIGLIIMCHGEAACVWRLATGRWGEATDPMLCCSKLLMTLSLLWCFD